MPDIIRVTEDEARTRLQALRDAGATADQLRAARARLDITPPTPVEPPAQAPAAQRFVTELYRNSPLAPIVNTAVGAWNVVRHPVETYGGLTPLSGTLLDLAKAHWGEMTTAAQKARDAWRGDRLAVPEAIGHGVAALLPGIGPAAARLVAKAIQRHRQETHHNFRGHGHVNQITMTIERNAMAADRGFVTQDVELDRSVIKAIGRRRVARGRECRGD